MDRNLSFLAAPVPSEWQGRFLQSHMRREKFPGAFDEGVALGGRDAEFVLLMPTKLKGWAFEGDTPNAEGVPTIPFEINVASGPVSL